MTTAEQNDDDEVSELQKRMRQVNRQVNKTTEILEINQITIEFVTGIEGSKGSSPPVVQFSQEKSE